MQGLISLLYLHQRIFFDDLAYCLGGWVATLFPRTYEKRFCFMLPATSLCVVFEVDKQD